MWKIFECLIVVLTVQIPRGVEFIGTVGKKNEVREKQGRIRAKLIDEDDPLSPYRAVEVLDKLQTQPEGRVNTLAVIPDLCLQRHADKQTMGVREIVNVEEEKQSNGKVFKKVCFDFGICSKGTREMFLVNHGRISIHHLSTSVCKNRCDWSRIFSIGCKTR